MHGKTCLQNAIRWCLYGKAINRSGKDIPNKASINIPALRNNENKLIVKLIFNIDSSNYELIRKLDFSQTSSVMISSLKIDGRAIDGGKIDDMIEGLIPYQISQFMLFDGELLKNFENLVEAVGSQQAQGIKKCYRGNLEFQC